MLQLEKISWICYKRCNELRVVESVTNLFIYCEGKDKFNNGGKDEGKDKFNNGGKDEGKGKINDKVKVK